MKPVILVLVAIGRRGGVPLALLMLLPIWVAWIARNLYPFEQWLLAALFGSLLAMALGAIAGMALPALQAHIPLKVAPAAAQTLRRVLWSLSLGIGALVALPTLMLPPASSVWWLLPWSLGHMTLAAATGVALILAPGLGMNRLAWGVRAALVLGLFALWRSMALALDAMAQEQDLLPAVGSRPSAWGALAAGVAALAAWAWAVPRLARLLSDGQAPRLDTRALLRTVLSSVLGASSRNLAGNGLAQWLALRHASPWRASPWEMGALVLMCVGVGYLGSTAGDRALPVGGLVSVLLWAVAVGCTALPWVQMPWMSPRVLLIPGGLRRKGLARQLWALTLKHNAFRAVFDSALLALALWLGWRLAGRDAGWAALFALIAVGAAFLPANFSVALGLLRLSGSRWREPGALLLGLLPAVSLLALYALGIQPRLDDPGTLWAWASLSWPISALISLLLLWALDRPMERLDLCRMPASPMSGLS